MDELTRKLEEARRHIHAAWDDDHAALVLVGMRRRAKKRKLARAIGVSALVVVVAIAASAIYDRSEQRQIAATPIEIVKDGDRAVELADGSTVMPLTPDSRIVLRQIAPHRVDVDFDAGSGRFEVLPNPQREFVISSGDVRVIVLGTAFTLERAEERTRVAVERGRVRVEWPEGERELAAGEAGWFPPRAPWRELAERGEYQRAYEALAEDRRPVRDEAAELLAAADVARLSGHPEEAVPFLRAIVDRHQQDPRAPLAAFTLGRVLFELGDHRDAARSFADAHRLDPDGSLAEDALVREIEAWSKSGERETAAERSKDYFARYPDGRRAEDVRMLVR